MKLQLKFFILVCIYVFSVTWGYAGSISGRVTDTNGNPLNSIYINAYIKNEQGYSLIHSTSTDRNGYYELADLYYGDSYHIAFINRYGPYVSVWHDKTIFLNEGDAVDTINTKMELGDGRITGRIESPRGQPFKQAGVAAYSWDGNNMLYVKSGHYDPNTGEYIMHGLASGDYYLFFGDGSDTYVGEGYPDEVPSNYSSPGNKTAVAVVAGQTTSGINAQLGDKGLISGQVTDTDGNPLENINVQVFWGIPGTYGAKEGVRNRDDITGVNGYYLIEGLYDGLYYLTFSDASHTYVSEAYNNESPIIWGRLGNKSAIKANIGEVSRADVQLEVGGTIRGQVTIANGSIPLSGIEVSALSWNGVYFDVHATAVVGEWGGYSLTGLATGDYYIKFGGNSELFVDKGYPNEVTFNHKSIGDKIAVKVVAGEVTENINAQLEPSGQITGKITDEQGKVISSASVTVVVLVWQNDSFNEITRKRTENDGGYTISGLPAGEYYLRFLSDSYAYQSELYNNVPYSENNIGDAKPVVVNAGETTSGIDARLTPTGTIEGQVIDQEGQAISQYISITIYEWDGKKLTPIRHSSTDADGKYSINGFESRDYYLIFSDYVNYYYLKTAYPNQNFIDLNRIDDKLAVTAKLGQVVSGIDIQLEKGPIVSGKVSDSSGIGLSGISVIAYVRVGGRFIEKRRVKTQSDGSYTLDGLALDNYYLKFVDENKLYASRGYPTEEPFNAIEIGSKSAIELTTLNDIENINIQLNQRGNLAGRVSDIKGKGLENVQVNTCLWKTTQFQCDNLTYTDQSGNYLIDNIEPGDYFIKFSDTQESQYLDTGYPMESPFDWIGSNGKNTVKVLSEQTTTGIDIQMEQAGSISGQVIDQSDTAIADILVHACVWELEGFRCLKTTGTDSNGGYSLKGLGSGQYYIVFEYADNGVNINSYVVTQAYGEELPFNWQTTYDKAVVDLVSGDKVVDIDIQMVNGGNITGQVTDKEQFAIKDLAVSACVWNNGYFACSEETLTDEYGNYRLGPLNPGSYYIRVNDPTGLYYETGYPNEMPFLSTQIGTKQQVTVNSDEIASGKNLQLELAPNLIISGLTENMAIAEDGDSVELDISLAVEPVGKVELSLSSDNSLEGIVEPTLLTFTSTNWNTPQRVQINGVDDATVDGHQLFQMYMKPSSASDTSYNGLAIKQLGFINRDNELGDIAVFIEQNEVETGTVIVSNIIYAGEIVENSRIKIEGGEYSINQGDWTSNEGSISSDDIVMVRHLSASDYGSAQETILTIGDTDYVFTSVTKTH